MNVYQAYDILNDRFFDSELPYVDIIFIDGRAEAHSHYTNFDYDIDGVFDPNTMTIGIDYNDQLPTETLVHEMIHVWQHMKGYDHTSHGRIFQNKCREIIELSQIN